LALLSRISDRVRHCGVSVKAAAGVRQMDRAVLAAGTLVRLTERFISGRETRLRF